MSRGSLPGFSQLSRRVEADRPMPRRPNAHTLLARPGDQPGVLWDAFREGCD